MSVLFYSSASVIAWGAEFVIVCDVLLISLSVVGSDLWVYCETGLFVGTCLSVTASERFIAESSRLNG